MNKKILLLLSIFIINNYLIAQISFVKSESNFILEKNINIKDKDLIVSAEVALIQYENIRKYVSKRIEENTNNKINKIIKLGNIPLESFSSGLESYFVPIKDSSSSVFSFYTYDRMFEKEIIHVTNKFVDISNDSLTINILSSDSVQKIILLDLAVKHGIVDDLGIIDENFYAIPIYEVTSRSFLFALARNTSNGRLLSYLYFDFSTDKLFYTSYVEY